MPDEKEYTHIPISFRKQVFTLLEKNHTLKPSEICSILKYPYEVYGDTVNTYKKQWKREYKNRLGLKCLTYHAARGWIYALKLLKREDVDRLISAGWRETRSRNRMLVWDRDKKTLGRLEWFLTGRINIWIRKPATWGKVKQLLAKAFCWNKLIESTEVFELWANTARFKGAHALYDYGERVPYARVDFLKEALGIVIKTGDVSDPTCLEIEFVYPDWAERLEKLVDLNRKALEQNSQQIENFSSLLRDLGQPKKLDSNKDYSW
jgi:hypothetical protein